MANTTAELARDIAEMPPLEYARLVTRLLLGVMYLSHSLLMSGVFGLEHVSHHFGLIGLPAWLAYATTAGELAGAVLLMAGVAVGQVALGLMPLLAAAAALHWASGIGATFGVAIYFAVALAGQGLLAGWTGPAAPMEDG